MKKLILSSPIPPSVNHYLAYRVVMQGKRQMACSYKTKEAKKYQEKFIEYVSLEATRQKWNIDDVGDKHIYIDTVFYFPRTNMDANNYFKVMLDAITETQLVWKDDNIVCERVLALYYDGINPHVELTIYPVEYIGIFSNEKELNKFEEHCASCTRYNRNCSLLRKAKIGNIQDEINDGICSSYKTKTK